MKSRMRFIPFATALLLLVLYSCGRGSSHGVMFKPEPEPKMDSICKWLSVKDHFYKENYYTTFHTYYEQKLQQKAYAQAAKALNLVADHEVYYLTFNPTFQLALESFDTLYANRLHWSKTLFIQSHIGNRLMDQGEFRKAVAIFRKVTGYKPIDYNSCYEIAYLHGDMAFGYSAIGEQEKALAANEQALVYFDQIGDLAGKGVIYDNIALVHLFTKNYAESEIYFDKAMSVYKERGDTSNMITTMHNRILLYQEMGDPRQYKLIDAAYKLFMSSGIEDPSLEVAICAFYMEKLLHENRMKEAKKILQNMQVPLESLPLSTMQDDYNISLAQYELKNGGIINIELIGEALKAVEKSEHYQNQLAFYSVLKSDAILRKDYKQALAYAEKEKIALDKLANREMIVKTMELNKKHQTEKKEQHIALQAKSILNKNIAIALLMTVLVIFCLVAAIILSRQKQKKVRAESKRAILYTRQLMEKTEEERKRIAGDLHDSVSHELLNLKNTIHESDSKTGEKIDAIINDIRIISRNLHPIMFEKVGLAASIEQLVERAQSIYDLMVTADIEYDDLFLSVSDELQVYRIVQEALSNIIKYAEAFAAKIALYTLNGVLYIEVKDNGKGFDVAEKIAGSTAFGLHNILERSKAIGGSGKIYSDKSGTVITIEIKKQHENTDS